MTDMFTSAEAYDRFMGRFSTLLSAQFVDFASPGASGAHARVLDIGCGTGMLTRELVERSFDVSAVDPSPPLIASVRTALPGVDARVASAEDLPFGDNMFDAALMQLVINFVPDPARGVAEMARVTRPGGIVAASVWDFGGRRGPLGVFEQARRDLDPTATTVDATPGAAEHYLTDLFDRAGLADVRTAPLTVSRTFASFDEWWEPFTLGVGPAGVEVARLSEAERVRLREHARELVGTVPFTIDAVAWAVAARVPA